ncbi:hypothetical protein V5O48_007633 [Marasmius crinis-equi]|uniref:Pentatricopeptide repeat-containing protein n=1 Tax=Marasmius crinis-equi TaxID=585013 RepID=A0ABR3FG35_9AGAR
MQNFFGRVVARRVERLRGMSSSLARAATRQLTHGIHSARKFVTSINFPTDSFDSASTAGSSSTTQKTSGSTTTPTPVSASTTTNASQTSPETTWRRSWQLSDKREENLRQFALTIHAGDPSRIWAHYLDITSAGASALPLKYHRQVLKLCTPSLQELRNVSAFRKNYSPHPSEGRLQTIIRNIRATGNVMANDYHFVLEQFAAVGHYKGAMQVYNEMIENGISLQGFTYDLCLRAIAHRLTLPEPKRVLPIRASEAHEMLRKLMVDMPKYGIPYKPITVDLCARIMKATRDIEGFEGILKLAYGIDMKNPDHLPLEVLGMASSRLSMTDTQPYEFFPLSTDGLNTILDFYGREKNFSKLVQAFEVLTAPLPTASPSSSPSSSSFDDEDDYGFVDTDISPNPIFANPSAPPNTTSIAIMMRHICRANHLPLARHYFLLALDYDRHYDIVTRRALASKPIDQVPSPKVSIDGHILKSIISAARRNHDVAMLRWIRLFIHRIIERKKQSIHFFSTFRRTGKIPKLVKKKIGKIKLPYLASDTRFKPLDLNQHIQVLRDDIRDIKGLEEYAAYQFSRERERLKERLGRRVWKGKDVYRPRIQWRTPLSKYTWDRQVRWRSISRMAMRYLERKRMDDEWRERRREERRNRQRTSRTLGKDFFTSRL